MQGGINAGAHGGQPVGGTQKRGDLRQYLIGVMHKGVIIDTHGVDSQGAAPTLGLALLLPVGFADVGAFVGGGRFAQSLQHGALALEDFLHATLHE